MADYWYTLYIRTHSSSPSRSKKFTSFGLIYFSTRNGDGPTPVVVTGTRNYPRPGHGPTSSRTVPGTRTLLRHLDTNFLLGRGGCV